MVWMAQLDVDLGKGRRSAPRSVGLELVKVFVVYALQLLQLLGLSIWRGFHGESESGRVSVVCERFLESGVTIDGFKVLRRGRG